MKNDESTFKKEFTRGVAARAPGYFWIRLVGWTTEFRAFVRVDIGVGPDVDVKFSFFLLNQNVPALLLQDHLLS